jgi:predicted GIY-YIG superfamily endonuclease
MTIGIYCITCNKTGDTYYGSSMNIEKRIKRHTRNTDNDTSSKIIIDRNDYKIDIVNKIENIIRLDLRKLEQTYIDEDKKCINKQAAYNKNREQFENSEGYIYKILCKDTGEVYIGSCRNYEQRKISHKYYKNDTKWVVSSSQIINRNNYEFILLDKQDEITDLDLRKLEQSYMDKYECINHQRAHISPQIKQTEKLEYNITYRLEHEEQIRSQRHNFYEENKERLIKEAKNNYEKNKEQRLNQKKEKYNNMSPEEKKEKHKKGWLKEKENRKRVKCPNCPVVCFEKCLKRHIRLKHTIIT